MCGRPLGKKIINRIQSLHVYVFPYTHPLTCTHLYTQGRARETGVPMMASATDCSNIEGNSRVLETTVQQEAPNY